MIDLGRDVSADSPEIRAYPTMAGKESGKKKKEYSRISLPATILDGAKVAIDDDIIVEVRGKVKGISKNDWNPQGTLEIEVHEGEVETNEQEAEEEGEKKESLLGGE